MKLDDILSPEQMTMLEKELSSPNVAESSARVDSGVYNVAKESVRTHSGPKGEAQWKDLIIKRSQELGIDLVRTGASDSERVKAMSMAYKDLTAFVCIYNNSEWHHC